MKKTLLILSLTLMSVSFAWSQCVATCSNYAVSAITFTTFTNLGTTVTTSFSPTLDDGYIQVPLGFNFNFYCTTYNSVLICSNGFLQFNIGAPPVQNQADATQTFPSPTAPNALVALNMNDLDPGSGGSVTYTTIGTSPNQKFILTYSNVPIFSYPASLNTGQIVLYEGTNIIEIYTGNVLNNSTTAGTQGIENALGTLGATAPLRNNVIWSGSSSAYQFAPFTPAPPVAISGNTTICEGTFGTYSTTAQTSALSYSWSFPSGWNGTSTTTAVTATAGAAGNVSVTATYTCGTSAATTLSINSIPAPAVSIVLADPQTICSGLTFTITPGGALNYTLSPGNYTATGTSSFIITAGSSTTYTLSGSDASNCQSLINPSTYIQVNPSPTVSVNSGSICSGKSFTMNPSGADSYVVSGGFAIVSPTAAGIYTYQIAGTNTTNLCTSAVPGISTLTVIANPSVTLSGIRTTICKSETVSLNAGGATTYSWNTGAVTTSISVSPPTSTVYAVTGFGPEGCSKTKTISITVSLCAGIEAVNGQQVANMQVYPNPASGLFHVQFNTAAEGKLADIYNAIGQLILSQKINAQTEDIDLTSQPHGMYYIKVNFDDSPETIKIIKN